MLVLAVCGCSGASNSRARDGGGEDGSGVLISLPDSPSGCGLGVGVAVGPDGSGDDPLCAAGASAVTFASDVLPIVATCSGEICHAPWRYDTLVGQHSTSCCDRRWLVAPGQPSASHLVQVLTGVGACTPQMPLDEGSLSNASIAAVVAWICQGALNN